MKKIKSILCIALLSTFLVGNVFAGDSAGSGVFSFFGNVADAVYSLMFNRDECRPRECQNCRPGQRDENGNCRPTEN
jgi:hypothetical protein